MDGRTERPWQNLNRIAFIGSYVPRQCGIGTFTNDLLESVAEVAPKIRLMSVAMNDREEGYDYNQRVGYEILDQREADYRLAADYLNIQKIDVVSLQHEYGLFGGTGDPHPNGEYILDLASRLYMPVVATLHTVLKEPTAGQKKVMQDLGEVCDKLVVMADRAETFLTDIYGIPSEKIACIPHGIPDRPFVDPNYYKDQFGIEGKKVILTFGLLSPNKGIEKMIEALPRIVEKYPDARYIVLGATHPNVKAQYGESYRQSLMERAQELGVSGCLRFYNRFVELEELCQFLGSADIYVTPYLNEAQIVSGTLAYALGTGNATVSTPYWYAQEMLADGRGKLVPFNDPQALADSIIELLDNEVDRHAMRKRAYQFSRQMSWTNVAKQYLDLFDKCKRKRSQSPRPEPSTELRSARPGHLPRVNFHHLHTLSDSCGIMQHANRCVPWRDHGYCTDDNARSLIAVLWAHQHMTDTKQRQELNDLAGIYLSFLHHALNPKVGRFRNFMSYDRQWLEEYGSDDSHARALWGLGETVAKGAVPGHVALAVQLFNSALPIVSDFPFARSQAYALIGIHSYLQRFSGDTRARRIRGELAWRLFNHFADPVADDWPWFEDEVTYANPRICQALLLSGQWMFEPRMVELGLKSLRWLVDIQTTSEGFFGPVGNLGWYQRGGEIPRFDQQPIEATCMIDACLQAHGITSDQFYLDAAYRALNWFLGDNDLKLPLYDPDTGGGCDGLQAHGVNENKGAESTLAWLLSLLAMYNHGQAQPALSEKTQPATAQLTEARTS